MTTTTTLIEKIETLRSRFEGCQTPEERYQLIIELGQSLPPLDDKFKIEANRVAGCQSTMYLHTTTVDEKIYFHAEADALISNGIAYLLTTIYSDERPEIILQEPPSYLEELGITASLSPTRANGLGSLHLQMKRAALESILKKKVKPAVGSDR